MYTKSELNSLVSSRLPDNTSRQITPAVLRSMFSDTVNSMGMGAYIDPHDYGAKGDAIGLLSLTVLSDLVTMHTVGNGIAKSQTVSGESNLSLTGNFVISGTAQLVTAHKVGIVSSGDDSGITFTVSGTNANGEAQNEVVTGSNANVAFTVNRYLTVTSIAVSGASSGTVVVGISEYEFSSIDVGKEVHLPTSFQAAGVIRTIASVSGNGKATLATSAPSAGVKQVIVGTDDTLAFEAAFDAAAKSMLSVQQLGTGVDALSWGPAPAGGTVKLRSGCGYLVRNTQARYDAGKLGAIMIPRHCGLEGCGVGQSMIYIGYGNVGHGVSNWGANYAALAADEHLYASNFSIYGNRQSQGVECLDGLHFATSMGNYSSVDNFSLFMNIQVHQANRHGVYLKGRGECLFYGMWSMQSKECGFFFDTIQDSRIMHCNAGGNGYTGFRCDGVASCEFNGCKSFYNGGGGGTDLINTANWYIKGGQYNWGSCMFIGCESQESRGSGFYILGGLCQFIGCLSSDPKRSAIGSTPRPYPACGFHIDGDASNNVFEGCYARAALGLDWGSTTENHYGGDFAVYIGYQSGNARKMGPHGNKGTIYTLEPSVYDVAKIGGTGTTNGLNGGLYIDGDALPTNRPDAPTLNTIVYGESGNAVLSYSAPASNGGRAITNYLYEYKLSADTEYTSFYHFPISGLTGEISGLTADADYDIRISAVNANGQSLYSNIFAYTHSPSAPFQITTLSARVDDGKARLFWTAPVTGGSAITDYIIEYKLSSEPTTWTTFSDGTSASASAIVTGLTNGSQYDFRVSAVNAIGTGTPSSTVSITPLAIMADVYDANLLGYYNATVAGKVIDGGNNSVETFVDIYNIPSNNMSQATEAYKPLNTGTVGTGAALLFDGANDYLNLPSALAATLGDGDFAFACVFQLDTAGTIKTNAILNNNSSNFLVYLRGDNGDIVARCGTNPGSIISWVADTNPHILVVKKTGATITAYLDGVAGDTAAASDVISTTILFGTSNIYYGQFSGSIGSAVFYNDDVSNTLLNSLIGQWNTQFGMSSATL
jgi:hypothetical protein